MRKFIGIFLFAVAFCLSGTGAFLVYQKIDGYKENERIYENVATIAVNDSNGADADGMGETVEIEDEQIPMAEKPEGMDENEYKGQYDGTTINWDELDGKNVAGWIMLGDTVNYPIMQGDDNSYYLKHAYDGTYNANGSIFMNSHNDLAFRDVNTIIYGHNLRSGKMFGTFKKYLREQEKGMHFYIYTPDGRKRTYEVISIAETKDGGFAYSYSFANTKEYKEYLNQINDASAFDTGYTGDINRRVVTLSTCRSVGSAEGWRVIIVGKEVENRKIQEPAKWYQEPGDDVTTILDIEENIEKVSDEINQIKRERKEKEAESQSKGN